MESCHVARPARSSWRLALASSGARLAGSHWILRRLARPHGHVGKTLHTASREDQSIAGLGPVRLPPRRLDSVLAKLITKLPHHMRMLLELVAPWSAHACAGQVEILLFVTALRNVVRGAEALLGYEHEAVKSFYMAVPNAKAVRHAGVLRGVMRGIGNLQKKRVTEDPSAS